MPIFAAVKKIFALRRRAKNPAAKRISLARKAGRDWHRMAILFVAAAMGIIAVNYIIFTTIENASFSLSTLQISFQEDAFDQKKLGDALALFANRATLFENVPQTPVSAADPSQ